MHYLKKDMQFTHYRWPEVENTSSIFTGEPSRRIFDPNNGNQVLFLINYYISMVGKYSFNEARLIESRIAYDLTENSKSERSVLNWLMGQG